MKVLILAGGLGTRFGEETAKKPKPMVEIGGKPILWHIMKVYETDGFTDFVILLGYKGEIIKEYFLLNPEPNWKIQFVNTGAETSKAQRIKKVEHLIDDKYFFVAYGDDVSDIHPKVVYEQHIRSNKIATLTAMPLVTDFGIVEINTNNTILRFREKPIIEGHWINGGFFCFSKEIFTYLSNEKEELEDQVFKRLAEEGKIGAYRHPGFWKCMNTMKDKLELDSLVKTNQAKWIRW